ncbi:retrovirus-related pol polyprotein from transposon TNT 1-94 [Tanacetum coccineum]
MKDNFEISMMGKMKFFLGLQIHQSPRGIFINQSQYTMELLRKHEMVKCDTVTTPMATAKIDANLQGTPTDQTKYLSMIGGLMYLTVAGVNVQFNIVLDADLRYQSLIYSLSILYSSLKGTHRTTPRSYRTPTLTAASPQEKMRKQSVRETSSPRKFLKATIKQKKQSTTPIPPASDDRERDEIVEANLLSLTLHKTALAAEAQENVAKVQEKLAEEEIEKMVEGEEDEESYESSL